MIALLNWLLVHWWVFFWLSVFGVFKAVREFFVGLARALGSIGERRHQRRMRELELHAEIERHAAGGAIPESILAVKPGPCVHRKVVPVIAADETVAAWLCRSCDTQLPADWAVREEDL